MDNRQMPPPPTELVGGESQNMPAPPVAPLSPAVAAEMTAEPLPLSKPIEVEALRDGFIHQERKKEGDKFTVENFKKLGSWMKCKDPRIQKAHEKAMNEKRKKVNKASDKEDDSAVE